jgi:hypothetical protein
MLTWPYASGRLGVFPLAQRHKSGEWGGEGWKRGRQVPITPLRLRTRAGAKVGRCRLTPLGFSS